jgi:hypothetical protein
VRAFLRKRFQDSIKVQATASVQGFGAGFPGTPPDPAADQQKPASANDVIDVEYHRHTED